MEQTYSFVSTVPLRRKRPLVLFFRVMLAVCLLAVVLGLLTGATLIAAIAPVALPLSYLLVRAGTPSREPVNLPVNSMLHISDREIRLIHRDLDLRDGRGPHTEEYRFAVANLKELRLYTRQQTLILSGRGQRLLAFAGQPAQSSSVSLVALHLVDPQLLPAIAESLARATGVPVQTR